MRWDHFLPQPLKPKSSANPWGKSLWRFVPRSWLGNLLEKRPQRLRRGLAWLGATWLAAPVRRLVQALALVVFLYTFFIVCWPYDAQPARVWSDLRVERVQADVGLLELASLAPFDRGPEGAQIVYLESPVAHEGAQSSPWRLRSVEGRHWSFEPVQPLSSAEWEAWMIRDETVRVYEVEPNAWPRHYADHWTRRERWPAEFMLLIDPLVAFSTCLAARAWLASLIAAVGILAACILVPRGFCGYLCPLGTVIDLFDASLGRWFVRWRVPNDGWWVHIKYYLLVTILVASAGGVLVSGYFAAIPIITRALLFAGEPLQVGMTLGWHVVPPARGAQWLSLSLFGVVLALGFLQPRFWCKYVCPSGAVFSLGTLLRATERKVESSCIHCNRCVEICPFDAIKADFTTRTTDCTWCQTCGGVCPTQAIKFVARWDVTELKVAGDRPTYETPLGRRGFVSLAVGSSLSIIGGLAATAFGRRQVATLAGDRASKAALPLPIRPPGSVPEDAFLDLCIRCGECFKACPHHVLQPVGWQFRGVGLWTPEVQADWAGCEPSCQACTQVCPTGAIRPLPLEEKQAARIGLAVVDHVACLPHAGKLPCQACVDECRQAGYDAIELTRVHSQTDADGQPVAESGFLAPVVRAAQCVGCGLCQTRCVRDHVAPGRLAETAIRVVAGPNFEDRLMEGRTPFPTEPTTGFRGSYRVLRAERGEQTRGPERGDEGPEIPASPDYLPDFLRNQI